jgi:hypothetical protein
MKQKKGFLLVSLVVYGAITVLLVAAIIRLAVLVIPVTYSLMAWCAYTPFYTAHDFILREFSNAPTDPARWLKADSEGFIWQSGEGAKAILVKKGALIYKEGGYTQGSWYESSTSLLAQRCRFIKAHMTAQGDRVIEIYCRAELIENRTYMGMSAGVLCRYIKKGRSWC